MTALAATPSSESSPRTQAGTGKMLVPCATGMLLKIHAAGLSSDGSERNAGPIAGAVTGAIRVPRAYVREGVRACVRAPP